MRAQPLELRRFTSMKRLAIAVAIVATLSGCATSQATYTPSGQIGHTIDCSGSFSSWSTCYQEAGALCGEAGYNIVDRLSGNQSYGGWGYYGGSYTMEETRTLVVECKLLSSETEYWKESLWWKPENPMPTKP